MRKNNNNNKNNININNIVNYNWKIPLEKGTQGYFKFNTTVEDAIREDIKNLLFTRHGERMPENGYGTNVLNFLFEGKTDEMRLNIANEIRTSILKWVKGVDIANIVVLYNQDITPGSPYFGKVVLNENSVLVIIYYSIQSRNTGFIIPNQNIALILNNG